MLNSSSTRRDSGRLLPWLPQRIRATAFLLLLATAASPSFAADCMSLLPLFRQGGSDQQIAEYTGLPLAMIQGCRYELSRPLPVGPAGAPPMNAAGPPPMGAVGRPPMGAAGAPPLGAAGPPPMGSTIRRLP